MSGSNHEEGWLFPAQPQPPATAVSVLYDLINEKDWEGAMALLENQNNRLTPAELSKQMHYQDEHGHIPLNSPAFADIGNGNGNDNDMPPDELILKLMEIGGKDLVATPSKSGWTILHTMTYSGAFSSRVTLQAIDIGREQLVHKTCNYGRSPMHCLFETTVQDQHQDQPHKTHSFVRTIYQKLLQVGGPTLLQLQEYEGQTPIHYLFKQENPSFELVMDIIHVGGGIELLNVGDYYGNTPIHLHFNQENPSIDFIKQVIEFVGQGVLLGVGDVGDMDGMELLKLKNKYNNTPLFLHFLVENPSVEFVKDVIELGGPELLNVKGPLHILFNQTIPSIELFQQVMQVGGPKLLQMKVSTNGWTPLHVLFYQMNPSIELFQKVMEQVGGPDLLKMGDNMGKTPLHVLLTKKCPSLHLFQQVMVEAGGSSTYLLKMGDNDGKTPLHAHFDQKIPSIELLEQVVEGIEVLGDEPQEELLQLLQLRDNKGVTPLHYHFQQEKPSVEFIMKVFNVVIGGPEILRISGNDGWTPLHAHFRNENPSVELVKLVVKMMGREILEMTDKHGMTPLYAHFNLEKPSIDFIMQVIEVGGPELLMNSRR